MMRIQVNGIVQHTWRATTDAVLTASPVVGLCGGGNKPHLGNHYFDLTNPFVGEEETLIRKAIRCRNAICGNQLGQKFNLAPLRSGDDWTKIRNWMTRHLVSREQTRDWHRCPYDLMYYFALGCLNCWAEPNPQLQHGLIVLRRIPHDSIFSTKFAGETDRAGKALFQWLFALLHSCIFETPLDGPDTQ